MHLFAPPPLTIVKYSVSRFGLAERTLESG
jgi:hypothetical protein